MNSSTRQILKSYIHFSPWGFGLWALIYTLMITTFGFGWPGSLLEEENYFQALQDPFYFMTFPLLFTQMVSSRLASIRFYSLAFMAPNYRHIHLKAAICMILLPGWVPLFAAVLLNSADIVVNVSILLSVTGVVLMYREFAPVFIKYSLLPICFILFLFMLFQGVDHGLRPRWDAPLWLCALLFVVGIALITLYVRQFLAGDEYTTTSEAGVWKGPGPKAVWISTDPLSITTSDQADIPQMFSVRERILQTRIDRFKRSNRSELSMGRLVAFATGEEQQSWIYFVGALLVVTIVLMINLIFAEGKFNDELDSTFVIAVIAIIATSALITGIISRILFQTCPLGNIWLRSAFSDKQATLDMMCELRARAALISLFLLVAITAISMEYSTHIQEKLLMDSVIRTHGTSYLVGSIGYICFVITTGLLFERLGRAWNSFMMGFLPFAVILLLVKLQDYFVPEPFQAANLPVTLAVFISGIGLLSTTFKECSDQVPRLRSLLSCRSPVHR